jgi:hypothetical protein
VNVHIRRVALILVVASGVGACGSPERFRAVADGYVRNGTSSEYLMNLAKSGRYNVTVQDWNEGGRAITLFQSNSGCKVVFFFDKQDRAFRYEFLSKADLCTFTSGQPVG